jgi:hypothetical protein
MTTIATRSNLDVATHVAATIDGIFAMIDGWRDLLEDRLQTDAPLTATFVDPLVEAFAVPAVSGDTLLTGSGFVAAPGVLDDAEWHLAWWLGGAGVRRLATIDDPSHEQFRDYTTLEWWRVPRRQRHAAPDGAVRRLRLHRRLHRHHHDPGAGRTGDHRRRGSRCARRPARARAALPPCAPARHQRPW